MIRPPADRTAGVAAPRLAVQPGRLAPACRPGTPAGSAAPHGALPAGPPPRTWTIAMTPGMELLTGNSRLSRYPRAALIKAIKAQGWGAAKRLRLPLIERAVIVVEYRPPAHRGPLASAMIHDADNLAPTGKALIDGIAEAGVFARDSVKYVRRVSYEFGPKSERGQVLLHITEVAP